MGRKGLLVDIGPLRRYPKFRRLWFGYLVTTLGNQLTVVAVPFEVFRLTHSSLDVGLVSLAQLGPLIAGSAIGGAIADAVDRRKLLLVTQTSLASCSAGLALDVMQHRPAIWPLFAISALSAGISSVDQPARSATFITLVERDDYMSANALSQLLFQVGVVVGPAVGGLLIASVGVSTVFWVDVATFTFSLVTLAGIGPLHPEGGGTRFGLKSVAEGMRYLKGRQQIQGTFVADLDAMIFGMPRALFPAIGLVRLHGGATTVGLLYAAPGAGALLGALFTGWVSRVKRQGMAVIIAIAVWGAAITAFGFLPTLAFSIPLLAIAGGADVVSAVFRSTILQTLVPDALRGRLSAIHIGVVTSGPRVGDVEAGTVAALAGVEFSVVSGGVACLVGIALIGWLMPRFTAYRIDSPVLGGAQGAAGELDDFSGQDASEPPRE
jgi:predicted MFS family arabinose efflux permease